MSQAVARPVLIPAQSMWAAVLAVLLAMAWSASSWGCTLPIFRYGLEQWHPDTYVVTIFTHGEASESARAVTDSLQDAADRNEGPANLRVQVVDVDRMADFQDPDQDLAEMWARVGEGAGDELMVVQYPNPGGYLLPVVQPARDFDLVWKGEPTREAAASLLESPLRREVGRRLLEGDSMVWVLVEGGDKEADEAAAAELQEWIDDAASTIPLPEIEERDKERYMSGFGPELKVAMSMIRLSRDDAAEAATLGMLLEQESGLRESKAAIAVPVFGRGRMLGGFTGEFFTQEMIHNAADFLIGSVDSCEIKDQNPGTDLLTVSPWSAVMQEGEAVGEVLPALPTLPGNAGAAASEAAIPVVHPSLYMPTLWQVVAVQSGGEMVGETVGEAGNPRVRENPVAVNPKMQKLVNAREAAEADAAIHLVAAPAADSAPTDGTPTLAASVFASGGLMWLGLILGGAVLIILALSVYVVRNGAAQA